MRYTCRSDDSLYWIRRPTFFPIFFFSFFSFFLFFWGGGGGGGGLKLRSYCRKFFRLAYQENMHFLSLRSNYTKNYGTNFHQIWYNGASYQRTDLRKIWHLSLQKCESRNFSFLFILLTRTPMFRTAMRSHVRYFDLLVYLFIYFNKIARC